MKTKRLFKAALFASLAGFVWSLLTIDPVVNSGYMATEDDGANELQNISLYK